MTHADELVIGILSMIGGDVAAERMFDLMIEAEAMPTQRAQGEFEYVREFAIRLAYFTAPSGVGRVRYPEYSGLFDVFWDDFVFNSIIRG